MIPWMLLYSAKEPGRFLWEIKERTDIMHFDMSAVSIGLVVEF